MIYCIFHIKNLINFYGTPGLPKPNVLMTVLNFHQIINTEFDEPELPYIALADNELADAELADAELTYSVFANTNLPEPSLPTPNLSRPSLPVPYFSVSFWQAQFR